ncbi:hypothetical protein HDU76_007991 [Blyttiomyces sp. JEL0837]|nr:hypothetical protein HDU76_007991 [Blyttiomyces sp. JEL0837]
MPTTSSTSSNSSLASSRWDTLPTEMKDQIISNTSIPTRFINSYPLTKAEIDANAHDIWLAVIKTNSWNLDLSVLPEKSFPTILNGLDQVTSREGYKRLCEMRPDLAGIDYVKQRLSAYRLQQLAYTDNALEDSHTLFVWARVNVYSLLPKPLINIAMRNCWMDELNNVFDNNLDDLYQLLMAGSCGHLKLFQHLFNKVFKDQDIIDTSKPALLSLSKMFCVMITQVSAQGWLDIIKFLVPKLDFSHDNKTDTYKVYVTAVEEAIYCKQWEVIQWFVSNPKIEVSELHDSILVQSAKAGNLELVKYMVEVAGVDPTVNDNDAVVEAESALHIEVVRFLKKYPGVDLFAQGFKGWVNAGMQGGEEFLKVLAAVNEAAEGGDDAATKKDS